MPEAVGGSTEDSRMVWFADPVDLALEASRARRDSTEDWLPDPFCLEVGRRLLLAQLQFSRWTLRRVERVQFERERSVSREISIDFVVRDDAPLLVGHAGPVHLVPLSVMRRRTLVNFALTGEDGRRLPMLGLRLTQQLDEAMLMAAADACQPGLASAPGLREFVQKAVAGDADQVDEAVALFRGERRASRLEQAFLPLLQESDLFTAVFHRLYRNFTLYVLLAADQPRHRVLTMAFDEPTRWVFQRPVLDPEEQDVAGTRTYDPMQKVVWWRRALLNTATHLGLAATRIRLQTPAAELATSYHFEANAPSGVRIVEASLLAGRPNECSHPVSVDRVVGHTPSVGLHAVEVPNVSLCRVQLKLRVPLHGWLTTLTVSCLVIVLVLGVVTWQWPLVVRGQRLHGIHAPTWSENQVTNVVLLLVTASASAATLIAQRESHGLAAAMVSRLRGVGICATALPIAAAVALVYAGGHPWGGRQDALARLLWSLTFLGLAAWLLTLAAALSSWVAERRSGAASPWDMTINPLRPGVTTTTRSTVRSRTFDEAAKDLGFGRPSIGVASAEGWHAYYGWNDQKQSQAVQRLTQRASTDGHGRCGQLPGCAAQAFCPRRPH